MAVPPTSPVLELVGQEKCHLGPPPGLRYVDAQLDAQDAKDRAELVKREAELQAAEKMAEQIETMRQQTEALAKLVEPKP